MSSTTSDDQQAAATSAFLAAMQQSHRQLQQQDLQPPPPPVRVKRQPEDEDDDDDDDDDADQSRDTNTAQPPRKAPRKSSTKDAQHGSSPSGQASTDSSAPAGPPYICPTCQTSYSRLEYLRRHERRHQDIRPFVCECGKGFSRSDVLSRHKRQCHYHLTGEQPSSEAVEAAAKKTRKPSLPKARKKAQAEGDESVDHKTHNGGQPKSRNSHHPGSSQSPPATSLMTQPGSYVSATQPGPPPPLLPQSNNGNGAGHAPGNGSTSMALPPPPPFYNQQQQQQQQHSQPGNSSSNSHGLMSAIHHALNTYGPSSHANYPPSPESSASVNSRNSSPRLHYRDAIPYTQRSGSTSNSRQSSLRKGTLDPYHAPPLWEPQEGGRSSPAPGSASSSRHGSVYGGSSRGNTNNTGATGSGNTAGGSANNFSNNFPVTTSTSTSTAAPAFSYPANEFASAASGPASGPHSQTLAPASDSATAASQSSASNTTSRSGGDSGNSRFNVSTGPLSPFGMGLSSISPYLNAFSNARDTPLVSSPGRGIGPGTPTSSLNTNVFDYTMRPPAKPASNTTPGKGSTATAAAERAGAGISSHPLKRKESSQREEPTTPSASVAMSATESNSLPAFADYIDDQQRSAANGLLTLLGGGGAETPSRFVRGEGGAGPSGLSESRDNNNNNHKSSNNAMENNPGTTSANPSSNPFFETAVTPGPEAFLLRLQGGEQERRAAGVLSMDYAGVGNAIGSSNINNGIAHAAGPPTSVLGTGLDTPGIPTSFDFSSMAGITPGQSSGIGWLLSPSIQSLISSFATPSGSGDGGSYFPSFKRTNSVFQHSPLGKEDQKDTKLANGLHLESAVKDERVPASVASAQEGNVATDAGGDVKPSALEQAFEDTRNPFFIPKQMFRACYSIPHWELPPLTRLSMLAMHAQQNLLKHVPILHEPTFRIDTTPGCLAFAACMLGSHEAGRRWWAGEEVVPHPSTEETKVQPQFDAEAALKAAAAKLDHGVNGTTATKSIDEEDGQELVKPIVFSDKMDMLMRSFATRCQHDKDKVPVVQALMLFQINNFLSSDATTRAVACVSHGSVVSLARKAGLYDTQAAHVSRDIFYTAEEVVKNHAAEPGDLHYGFSFLPSYLSGCPDEDKIWRQWCEYEGRRRTAFIVLLMDMVASLDAGLPALVDIAELKHLPLPASDAIWRSKTAESFRAALRDGPSITFGEAMQALLCDELTSEAESKGVNGDANDQATDGDAAPSILKGIHGPFARLMMLLPILRGIVHLLQGRIEQAATRSPLEPWLQEASRSPDPTSAGTDGNVSADWQVDLFKRALGRWREAWDGDASCLQASSPAAQAAAATAATAATAAGQGETEAHSEHKKEEKKDSSPSPPVDAASSEFTSKTASGATPLCEDALPFYWLSHVLLGHATSRPVSVRKKGEAGTGLPFSVSNGPSSAGRHVPDFRSMLRFAKSFVNSGEGTNGSAGAWGLPLGGKKITTSIA